jgi:hypothetical protein
MDTVGLKSLSFLDKEVAQVIDTVLKFKKACPNLTIAARMFVHWLFNVCQISLIRFRKKDPLHPKK